MRNANEIIDIGFEFITNLSDELDNGTLDLPVFPEVALRIKEALSDPEITAEQVARIVGSDPVFSARLLKLANSVIVNGTGMQINDLRVAIMRMGFDMAYNTAVSIAVEQVMKTGCCREIRRYLEELWNHSVKVAAYSYVIAGKQTTINPDEAMLAGLLHDIGKFYILTKSENYPALFSESQALEDIMQDWHTAVGRSILEAWNFSEEIATAADEHESLDRTHFGCANIVDVVLVANLFSRLKNNDELPELNCDAIPAIKRLKLSAEDTLEIINESEEEIRSITQALG